MSDTLRGPEYERLLRQETLIIDATEAVAERMNATGADAAEVAGRAGMDEDTFRDLLEGGDALTLRRLADVGHALGAEPRFSLDVGEDGR